MYTKNHENCSQIECFMSQKPLVPKFLSQIVFGDFRVFSIQKVNQVTNSHIFGSKRARDL